MLPTNKDYSKKIITIPNVISFFRLLLIPLVVYLYIIRKDPNSAIVVLAISGISDIIDGKIARYFHMVSDIGKVLDPVADKCTQAAILLCLTTTHHHMLIPFLLMVIKEPCMSVEGMIVLRHTFKVYGAEWHGKLNTTMMFIMYTIHLLWKDIPPLVSDLIIALVSFTMILSFVLYSIRNYRIVEEAKAQKGSQPEPREP